jgi:transposase
MRIGHPGKSETVAYDLTSVLFFGISCPLTELGYNTKHAQQLQVNLALLVSKNDKCPISHFIYNGSRSSSSTIKNLVAQLKNTDIQPGTLIWDRGNVSKDYVKIVELAGWKLICGIPKTSKDVKKIIEDTDVPISPDSFVHKGRTGHIYAKRTTGKLFGEKRSVVVYANQERRTSKINDQNEVLAYIGEELNALSEKRKGTGSRIEFKFRKHPIALSERLHGKYMLFSSDESLPSAQVVKAYFEKDFVEKVFRTLKTTEEMEPVRHRLEQRVRVYIFVCVLAYRLLAYLQWRLENLSDHKDVWKEADAFLHDLERVERVEIRLGHQVRIWHLNLTGISEKTLEMIGFKDLLKETTAVDFKL